MKQIQDTLRINQPAVVSPESNSPRNTSTGSLWADEMDRQDPPGKEESSGILATTPRASRKMAEVSEHIEQHLVRSFACLENEDQHRLTDCFALPKVAVTKTPELDKIIVVQCSESNDQALARIQALNSDALGP